MPFGLIFIDDPASSFCISGGSKSVLRLLYELFDQENAALPLQRTTFFNICLFLPRYKTGSSVSKSLRVLNFTEDNEDT